MVWADCREGLQLRHSSGDGRIPLTLLCHPVGLRRVLTLTAGSIELDARVSPVRPTRQQRIARFNAGTVGALPLPHSIICDSALAEWTAHASTGKHSQSELDELTAPHLGLAASALRTLASVA